VPFLLHLGKFCRIALRRSWSPFCGRHFVVLRPSPTRSLKKSDSAAMWHEDKRPISVGLYYHSKNPKTRLPTRVTFVIRNAAIAHPPSREGQKAHFLFIYQAFPRVTKILRFARERALSSSPCVLSMGLRTTGVHRPARRS
jgi:hypothetical protein